MLMMFNVPQYIDIEDKIAGPLTAKQFGWMLGMGVVLFLEYVTFDQALFFTIAVPTVLLFAALAFYKPQGIPLIRFLVFFILYLFRPKHYVWRREAQITKLKKQKKIVEPEVHKTTPQLSPDDIAALAQTLDSGGRNRSERVAEILQTKKKK